MGQRWGRQIPVSMSRGDERRFLSFVKGTADVQILVAQARTPEGLFLDDFTDDRDGTQFFLLNRAFPWTPDIALTAQNTPYIRNLSGAPVIEYGRTSHGQFGRLFWSKGLSPGGEFTYEGCTYAYDAEKFQHWYEHVISWVKANSRERGAPHHRRYYMRGAWWRGGWLGP
jgi:hypothetical protein